MTTPSMTDVIERLRSRAAEDADIAETLVYLAERREGDPFERPGEVVLASARDVNARRQAARRENLAGRALTTRAVVELVGSMSDRRAVDRRRHRGRLLGLKVGRTVLHPDWQFDRRRGDTRPGLPRVLEALREVSDDPFVADALMVAPRGELGGRSVAEVFADGDLELAVRLILLSGDQS